MKNEFKINGVKFRCVPAGSGAGWCVQYFSRKNDAWRFVDSCIFKSLAACFIHINDELNEFDELKLQFSLPDDAERFG